MKTERPWAVTYPIRASSTRIRTSSVLSVPSQSLLGLSHGDGFKELFSVTLKGPGVRIGCEPP